MGAIDIPGEPGARNAWIKYQLELRGWTLGAIDRKLNVGPGTTKTVLRRPYPRMERVIAKLLGLAPSQIWPERYTAEGEPIRGRMGRPVSVSHGSRHITRAARGRNGYRKGVA